jgi:hypothetical protein
MVLQVKKEAAKLRADIIKLERAAAAAEPGFRP